MNHFRFTYRLAALGLTVILAGTALPELRAADKKPAAKPAGKPAAPKPAIAPTSDIPETLVQFEKAKELYQDGKWPEALAAFQKFEQTQKISTLLPQVINFTGWCYFNLQKYTEAINAFDRLIKQYPDSVFVPEVMLKKAECLREAKDFAQAQATYRAFQQKFEKHDLIPYAMLGEAWVMYKQGVVTKATDFRAPKAQIARIRQLYSANPTLMLDTLFLLGQILTQEKDFDGARGVYRQIAEKRRDPRATEGVFLAGEAMWDAKQYNEAIGYYKNVQAKAEMVNVIQRQIKDLEAARGEYIKNNAVSQYQTLQNELAQRLAKFRDGADLRAAGLFRIANCYQALGKPEEATAVYRYLLEAYADDTKLDKNEKMLMEETQYSLIQVLTERKLLEQAKAESEKFKAKYPNSIRNESASFLQAETNYGTGNYKEALKLYEKFRGEAKNAEMLETAEFRIGACYYAMEDWEKAIESFNAFLQKHAKSKMADDALFRVGRAHFEIANKPGATPQIAQPHLTDAVKAYERIRTEFPKAENMNLVTFQLGYLYGYLGAYDRDEKTGKLTTTATYDKAIAAFQDFIKGWPDHKLVPEAWWQSGQNQAALQHYDDTIAAYQTIVDKYPEDKFAPFAAFEIGSAQYAAKRPDKMIEAFRNYVTKFPEHARVSDAIFAIGSQLEADKKPKEAITEYRTLIARGAAAAKPDDALLNVVVGAELRIVGLLEPTDPKAALTDCEGFLAKFKDHSLAVRAMITQMTAIYRKAKPYTDAYAKFDQLATQYAANTPLRIATTTSVIDLALAEKNYQRATATTIKLLADPEKDKLPAMSYVAIGNTFLKTDKPTEARDNFQKLLAQYPNDAKAMPLGQLGLGQALVVLKQYDEAGAALQKMLAADPQSPLRSDAELALSKVHEAKGRMKEAVDLYNRVMANARGENSIEAAYRLGSIFFNNQYEPQKEKDNKKMALAYYARLLFAGGPLAEEAAFRTAQCHEALGGIEVARAAYQGYLRRFPEGKFRADADARLRALPPPPPQP